MGFAAEIKEFLGAAKDSWKLMSDTELKDAQSKYTNVKAAAEQKEMDDPLNQQLKEAKLAHMKATTGQIGRESPLDALRRKALELEIAAANNPPAYGPAVTAGTPNTSYGGKAAADPYDPNAVSGVGGGFSVLPTGPSKYGYGGSHAKGGLVRKFAVGGIVDDEDLEGDVTPEVTPGPAVGTSDTTDISAQRRPAVGGVPMPRPKPSALTDALKYGATQIQQLPAIGSSRQRALRGYAQGAGAAPMDDMIQVYRKIDPKGEMGESERNLHALQAVWNFKQNQGDPEGAARAAFQMLQTYKVAATRYAALAKAAIDGGQVDEGLKLAMKAYANVPDGNNMKLYRGKDGSVNWKAEDKDGNPISGGIATPDEIGTAAARLATPGQYENYLVQASSGAKLAGGTRGAGGKQAEPEVEGEAGGGFKASKPSDYKELKQEQIDQSVDNWYKAIRADPKTKNIEMTPKELASTKNMLFHLRANNQITDDEGLRRISTIVTGEEPTSKGEPPPFRAIENKEAKTHTIMFPDGGELVVPNTQLGMFRSARHEYFAEQAKKAQEAADKANRPSGWAMATEAAEDLEVKRKKWAEGMDESAKDLYNKSTLGAVGRGAGSIASQASDWLSKTGKTIKEEGGAGAIGKGVGSLLGGGASAAPAPINPDEDRPL